MQYRVGFGYDVHRLADDLPLRVGGVTIPHTKGAVGHSDADVLIHAICDALLGAAAMGDIGNHFPDTDESFKGIDSLVLLERTLGMISESGYSISNIDSTVVLQLPKIAPYIDDMRSALSMALGVEKEIISVKATTEERLGFTGRQEGIAAYAVALIYK